MKVFVVSYRGLWLGGKAVVLAESSEEALRLAEQHPETACFQADRKGHPTYDASAEEITADLATPAVLYNDNGDY